MKRIALHSVPRSGSTWLGEIFNSHPGVKYCFQPLFSYKFKGFLNDQSTQSDVIEFFDLLRETDDEFICQREQRDSDSLPSFKKNAEPTHVVYKEVRYHQILENLVATDKELRLILLVRNPIEVMNSWINSPKEFDPSWDIEKELMSGESKNIDKPENFYGLAAWISTTKAFEALAKAYPWRVFLLKYSDLTDTPIETVRKLFAFCELNFATETDEFLCDSRTKRVDGTYSVFRGNKKSRITLEKQTLAAIVAAVKKAGLSRYLM